MTFIYEPDLNILKMYQKMNFVGQDFQELEDYRQTRKLKSLPPRIRG